MTDYRMIHDEEPRDGYVTETGWQYPPEETHFFINRVPLWKRTYNALRWFGDDPLGFIRFKLFMLRLRLKWAWRTLRKM